MEEQNNYFNYGETPNMLSGDQNEGLINGMINGLFETGDGNRSDNIFSRWLHPEIAEQKQFERENYFMDKQNAFNEYMYERALNDNSPAAQMERAKAAGINPNLAAGGIMGMGNAVATPMQGASGQTGMNTNAESPFNMLSQLSGAITGGIQGANVLGELFGFGKKNKAEIKQLEEYADKAAKEANFTFWQTRQFKRLMPILYDQAQTNLEETQQNIQNLKKLYEVYDQQKWNIASDTNLNEAQTGEVLQDTKNKWYEQQRLAFEDAFRKLFGVQITESGLNMLVQACLSGKGDAIITAISDGLAKAIGQAKDKVEEHLPDILLPFGKKGKEVMKTIGTKAFKKLPKSMKIKIIEKIGIPYLIAKQIVNGNVQ